MAEIRRPPRLRPGDSVAIVAPAGPVPREAFEAGARRLAARYDPTYSPRVFERSGYLAGSDEARARELQAALDDPTVKAIFCARGGYGMMRILAQLDRAAWVRAPKPVVGFSDITALHALLGRAGVVSIHGPVVTQLGKLPDEDVEALFALLESTAPAAPLEGLRALCPGRAEGRLAGGNLEIVSRLVGTPFMPELTDAVLLIEEIGERPYRIDRMLTQLELAGALSRLRGALIGDLVACEEKDRSGPSALEVLQERLGRLGVPVLAGAPIGHGTRNRAVALGTRVELDAAAGRLTWLEPAVAP